MPSHRLGIDQEDQQQLGGLLAAHRERLVRIVALRLDPRVQGRVDPSDVIQDAYVEACQRIEEFHRQPAVPFFVWLRFLAVQKLGQIHRRELGTQARDASRDVSVERGLAADASSAVLAAQLVGKLTGPGEAALRAERQLRLQEALDRMRNDDREVLALKHYEQLSNSEIAHVLGITESAACRRYVRALQRFKAELAAMPGGLSDWEP
jgi:RNA polymerase sigma-70 factor (ECF subfamily)